MDTHIQTSINLNLGGDHDRFTHVWVKEDLLLSQTTGAFIRAFCGKVDAPRRDADNYPFCTDCRHYLEGLQDIEQI